MSVRAPSLAALLAPALFAACGLPDAGPGSVQARRPARAAAIAQPPVEVVVTPERAAVPVALPADAILTVEIAAKPSTGYVWELATITPALLAAAGRDHVAGAVPGEAGLDRLYFRGLGAGRATLVLVQRRPWEQPVTRDATTFALTVDVAGVYIGPWTEPVRNVAPQAVAAGTTAPTGGPSRYDACDPGDGTHGACTPVRNQGSCGSCWAFATVGVAENVMKLHDPSKASIDLSEQYLISCVPYPGTYGCDGGWASFDWYTTAYRNPPDTQAGAVYESEFPYAQGSWNDGNHTPDVQCGSSPHPHHERLARIGTTTPDTQAIKDAIRNYGPVWVTVCADGGFSGWNKNGPPLHDTGGRCANHAVVLTGWDDDGGDGYWFLRNSWGSGWGDHGYMRIAYGANGVADGGATYAVYPRVGNKPPTAVVPAVVTAPAGTSVTLDATGSSDADGTVVKYAWAQISGPSAGMTSVNPSKPQITVPTTASTPPAPIAYRLTVTDNDEATASANVRIDRPPTASAGATQTADEGATVTLAGAGADLDGDAVAYAWIQTGGTAASLSSTDGARTTFKVPLARADATLTFKLTVTDALGAASSATTTVRARHLNQPPVANAGADRTVRTSSTVTLDGSASADYEGPIATWAWTQTGGPAVALAGADTAHPTFTAPAEATTAPLAFGLTVTDASGATATDSVAVTVVGGSANLPPVANAGPDQTILEESAVALDGSASADPDGRVVRWSWVQTAGPVVALWGASSARVFFDAPAAGDEPLSFTLTVTDDKGATATATVKVTVTPHPAGSPTAAAGPAQTVKRGETVTLDGTASKAGASPIASYAWTQTGGTAVAVTGTDAATATFEAPAPDGVPLTFTLTVTDGAGLTGTATTAVTVAPSAQKGGCASADPAGAGAAWLLALGALVRRARRQA